MLSAKPPHTVHIAVPALSAVVLALGVTWFIRGCGPFSRTARLEELAIRNHLCTDAVACDPPVPAAPLLAVARRVRTGVDRTPDVSELVVMSRRSLPPVVLVRARHAAETAAGPVDRDEVYAVAGGEVVGFWENTEGDGWHDALVARLERAARG